MGDIEFIYERIGDDEKDVILPVPESAGARLSKDFRRAEFTCHCGCGFDTPDSALVAGLQELRDALGRMVTINSACRCAQHNKKVGGVPDSQHVYGKAADIVVQGMSPQDVLRAAEGIDVFERGGIGVYDTFVHVDVRGKRARWDNR